jgi:hypothetical protein
MAAPVDTRNRLLLCIVPLSSPPARGATSRELAVEQDLPELCEEVSPEEPVMTPGNLTIGGLESLLLDEL